MAEPDAELHVHTSVAVWDVASPVVVNRDAAAKVGVKCSASCCLAGQRVEIRDQSGSPVGDGLLGETPWPGTVALYVAELKFPAPPQPGVFTYRARFDPAPQSQHAAASSPFNIVAAIPPVHTITVEVTDRLTGASVENVSVRCDIYRGVTDSDGVARLQVPSGTFEVSAWKSGYEDIPSRRVQVSDDLVLHVQSAPLPERNLDDESMWM